MRKIIILLSLFILITSIFIGFLIPGVSALYYESSEDYQYGGCGYINGIRIDNYEYTKIKDKGSYVKIERWSCGEKYRYSGYNRLSDWHDNQDEVVYGDKLLNTRKSSGSDFSYSQYGNYYNFKPRTYWSLRR